MRTLKNISAIIVIVIISLLGVHYLGTKSPIAWAFHLLIAVFLIFNLIVRKSLSFKNYFTSRFNLLTTKSRSEQSFDIPKGLMFEKIIEVIDNSDFKLVETDTDKLEILATSRMTFMSWGENLYISFEEKGSETIMKFCSTTFFSIYAWGKNEKNYTDLMNEIESSLVV